MARSACWRVSDLLTGKVRTRSSETVIDSREFVEFLKLLDAAYPTSTAIKLVLDNHSAHVSRETRAWLASRPAGRFQFTFIPKHGSWLNLIEGFFSKFARSVLRHIRVTSKHAAQGTHHGRHRRCQSSSRHPHLVLQASRRPHDMIRTKETLG